MTDDSDPVATLVRWQQAGAVWRVIARDGDSVTVSLCQCDGGAEAARLTSSDPDLLRFLSARRSSED